MNINITNKKIAIIAACVLLGLILCVTLGMALSGMTNTVQNTESTQEMEGLVTEVFGTEIEMETEEVIEEVVQTIAVKLSATSIEKDLKVKVLDENNARIKGQPFVITVTPEGASEGKEYNDHDMDGIIYMKSMTPGKYIVQLHAIEGFVIAENPVTATVKDKIAYEKVEIKNEIKDESEIDVSIEDTSNKDIVVEEEIKDTLPLLESAIVTTEVEKDQVDLSNFPVAYVKNDAGNALPSEAILFTHGSEASKNLVLYLNINEAAATVKDIIWSTSSDMNGDSEVAQLTISADERSATLTAQTEGVLQVSVQITYETESSAQTDGDNEISGAAALSTVTETYICQVCVVPQTDESIALKDLDGSLLYSDEDAETIATVKDFAEAEKFYANPQYVGWHTIDGKLYYYKEDYTRATGKQIIGGVIYEFDEAGYLIEKVETTGIDVSKWNGDIDWEAVAGAGIDFAIIRCGYRGTSTGALVEDPYFKQNIEGAVANGIKVGVYFYSQAISEVEAVEEASMALELVKGYHLQFPIFIDTEESGGRADKISVQERTNVVKAFCETVKNAGYKPGVYSGKWWYTDKLNASELEQYHIWVAQYNTECNYSGRYDMWQYTERGKIPGIDGKVDMNICYRTYY